MPYLSSDLVREIRRQRGVVTGDQLRADGLDADTIERLRLRHLLVRHHRDVYAVASADDDLTTRCVVACLADPYLVIGGASAAALWDFDHVFRPHRPDVWIPHAHVVDRPVRGTVVRRERLLGDDDVDVRGDRIRLLTRARTWLACVDLVGDDLVVRFTRHVLDAHCDLSELWDVVDRWEADRRGPPGRAQRILETEPDWRRPTVQPAEQTIGDAAA